MLNVAILSSGRFYVCDLARELSRLGNKVIFYSLVPPSRLAKFGIDRDSQKCLLYYVFPLALLARAGNLKIRLKADKLLRISLDNLSSRIIKKCDVFIGMSGLCNSTIPSLRSKGLKLAFVERGSRHILSQREILSKLPNGQQVSDFDIRREMNDYRLADVISVLSRHCYDSFIERGVPDEKLFCNTLGVDLSMFSPTAVPKPDSPPTVIMTGAWSYRKGCNLIFNAVERMGGVRFLHVGPVHDCPIPSADWFEHYDAVDQTLLREFYAKAHVFCLPSFEEGLAIVQLQALASGLRLVCSTNTGGSDLKRFLDDEGCVSVIPPGNVEELVQALKNALELSLSEKGLRNRFSEWGKTQITWASYAKRYDNKIAELLRSKQT